MNKLYAPSTIKKIREKYGFQFSKSLGQNFLIDQNIINKIVEGSLISEDDLVIEIGPGIGVLTAAAAEYAKKVITIEIDKNLIPILNETLVGYSNISVINSDVLKIDLNQVIEENIGDCTAVKIIGNLPYYITTPIIMHILEEGIRADSITIMLQKEVAERLGASHGTKNYGAISVVVQYYCQVEAIANVPKESFMPSPKVDSRVIKLNLRKEKPVSLADESIFFKVIKSGFGQRRKTLLNSLSSGMCSPKEFTAEILESVGIDPTRRAETLSIEEFASIANAFHTKRTDSL